MQRDITKTVNREDLAIIIQFPKDKIIRESEREKLDEETASFLYEISASILTFLGGRNG